MTGLPDSQSFFRVSSPCSSSSLPSLACPCGSANATTAPRFRLLSPTLRARRRCLTNDRKGRGLRRGRPCMFAVSAVQAADGRPRFGFKLETDKRRGHQLLVVNNLSNQFQGYQTFDDDEEEEQGDEELQEAGQPERWDDDSYIRTTPKSQERKQGIKLPTRSRFTTFQEDPMVDKLRTQLGPMHPIPTPPLNRNVIAALFVFFFAFGVLFDKLWTARKRSQAVAEARAGIWPQVPTSFSLFLEKDLQRKESVEWVNMVVAKLWKVYREGLENWLIGLLQPVVDDLKKPDYVERVEIKQFDLGEAPLSVRNVERRTSRRANDLQYQIGLRYTGDARMLLSLKLKFGIIPVVVPVGIRDFDIDGELWVKLRLIPSEPWVGALSWAFVSLPKIKFVLSPFRLFNLMGIPVLSMFLLKLLTEDLPRLFVRPKKIVLDFQKGKALGPVPDDFTTDTVQEGNRDFVGELSVTLVDARRLVYFFFAKTDPYVILSLGNQVIRSKKNSQTTVIGPPGEPIWNQDFHMFVTNPRKQKLTVQVKDSIGFTDITIGSAEVELGSLQDTVPTDKIVSLRGSWTPLNRGFAGEILVRLTYKAYVEDEEEDTTKTDFTDRDTSDDEMFESDEISGVYEQIVMDYTVKKGSESFMDVLTALIVSEEFRGIVDSAARSTRVSETSASSQPSTPVTLTSSAESTEDISDDSRSGDPVLLWLAAITSLTTLISVNIGGSSLFNP